MTMVLETPKEYEWGQRRLEEGTFLLTFFFSGSMNPFLLFLCVARSMVVVLMVVLVCMCMCVVCACGMGDEAWTTGDLYLEVTNRRNLVAPKIRRKRCPGPTDGCM
ncbi:hypothetical protein F4804DRAFT_50221 [Jackrogersella minutella]|nr:hypothetical protein F4804DRAFT_50221 [Jackrogersella minutella]